MTPDAGTIDFERDAPVVGALDVRWIHGLPAGDSGGEASIQVHAFDPHTFILRQSKTVSYEAPFMYLFFGNARALLLDTGATADRGRFPLRDTVDTLLQDWLADHPRDGYELVVAHTHGHGDHVAADGQFEDRPSTVVVAADLAAVRSFFGISAWPDETVRFDLGGRVMEVVACPGHHETSMAVYDPWSGFLVTGDTVYPGRLYVREHAAYLASMDRLIEFAATRPVRHVMGCHIEMSRRPGRDYPIGSLYQPDEMPLPMNVERLRAVREALAEVGDRPGVRAFDDFIIFNGSGGRSMPRYVARSVWHRFSRRVPRYGRHRATSAGPP
jgi:glyoxylase-like metal-dependent hydrolase (beta-lactamase superfamily II)